MGAGWTRPGASEEIQQIVFQRFVFEQRILTAHLLEDGRLCPTDLADRSLRFCFERWQSPDTGLFYWGAHAGWDFQTESRIDKPAGNVHEFYRPYVLWDRSWQLAPEPCRRFALGLWEHQIGNHRTGDTLMMALLRLWQVRERPGQKLRLVFTDR